MEKLSEQEKQFCELYCNGAAPYGGNATKCYAYVFKAIEDSPLTPIRAKDLLNEARIQDNLGKLEKKGYKESAYMKKFLASNLMKIVEEASSGQYKDRFNTDLSPAPLRSVAVSAAKALTDLYPVKESQKQDISINGEGGDSGITFNLIIPEKKDKEEED